MSLRDVEDLLAERGIDVSYETVRCWANKFGPAIAANIRKVRGRADSVWHLEMVVCINGARLYMWRAVDKEGEVLDVLVQKRQNKAAALKLLRKLLKNQRGGTRANRDRRAGFVQGRDEGSGLPQQALSRALTRQQPG